jgi:hypothetical protein
MAGDDEAEVWELVVSISNPLDESLANEGRLVRTTTVDSAFRVVVRYFSYRFLIVLRFSLLAVPRKASTTSLLTSSMAM